MDNFNIDVTASGRETFEAAMSLAQFSHNKAVAYAIHPNLGMVFFWHGSDSTIEDNYKSPGFPSDINPEAWQRIYRENRAKIVKVPVQKLPYPMSGKALTEFAWHWLESADFGPKPNIDGSCTKGWRVYNEGWGRVGDSHYSFVAVQPQWAMHGK